MDPDARRKARSRALALAAAACVTACASAVNVPVYPLYAGEALAPGAASRLFGSIASVDGRDVSNLGSAFELAPGCHVVLTADQPVDSTNYIATVGTTGARAFALEMKPGYSYFLRRDIGGQLVGSAGSDLRPIVTADERDPSGVTRQTLYPARSQAELAACANK